MSQFSDFAKMNTRIQTIMQQNYF